MSRRIVTTQYQSPGAPLPDSYFDRIVKYIPSDIVAAWTAVIGLTDIDKDIKLLWIAFAVGVVLTFLWTLRQTSDKGKSPAITQCLISTGAFSVWVAELGEPFKSIPGYDQKFVSLLLILSFLISGLIVPPKDNTIRESNNT